MFQWFKGERSDCLLWLHSQTAHLELHSQMAHFGLPVLMSSQLWQTDGGCYYSASKYPFLSARWPKKPLLFPFWSTPVSCLIAIGCHFVLFLGPQMFQSLCVRQGFISLSCDGSLSILATNFFQTVINLCGMPLPKSRNSLYPPFPLFFSPPGWENCFTNRKVADKMAHIFGVFLCAEKFSFAFKRLRLNLSWWGGGERQCALFSPQKKRDKKMDL